MELLRWEGTWKKCDSGLGCFSNPSITALYICTSLSSLVFTLKLSALGKQQLKYALVGIVFASGPSSGPGQKSAQHRHQDYTW